MDSTFFNQYLALLGLPQKPPDFNELKKLVARHLMRIPFENISKVFYHKNCGLNELVSPELFLHGIATHNFGGTCYINNYYFNQLLAYLGYDIRLCAADMNNPDVHIASIVTINREEYLIDVGYAAPFYQPLPLDLTQDYTIPFGRDIFILKPRDKNQLSRLELIRDGQNKHGYTLKPQARKIEEFYHIIADSFRPQATFLNSLLIVRFFPDYSLMLHNYTLIETTEQKSKVSTITDRKALIQTIHRKFAMPADIVSEVLEYLPNLNDAWI